MKEWIYKDGSGEYVLTTDSEVANLAADAVEVPEGSDFAMWYGAEINHIAFYKKIDGCLFVKSPNYKTWTETLYESIDQIPIENESIGFVAWKREKPQEKCADKLPMEEALEFAEELRNMGESSWSKEKHSHYKKDVSHLNVIDPYRIADLYDLHPCAEHIMKKSLCAGGRGHKDLLRDIQDIIDTAERWKEMIEEDNREV